MLIRLPTELLERVKAYADDQAVSAGFPVSQAAAARKLIQLGLDAAGVTAAAEKPGKPARVKHDGEPLNSDDHPHVTLRRPDSRNAFWRIRWHDPARNYRETFTSLGAERGASWETARAAAIEKNGELEALKSQA